MRKTTQQIALGAEAILLKSGRSPALAAQAGADCAWLEAVSYPGLNLLIEALADTKTHPVLERDALGLDLQNVSCVFLAARVQELIMQHGRLFLRNVRHGLYLLPGSVVGNYGIGCPVDPGFGLGGERGKHPYAEKLAKAARDGVEVDETVWQALRARM